ncbi:MAG: CPBP family intramembrane metalloprotease, partial [Chloroflexota bacterium]
AAKPEFTLETDSSKAASPESDLPVLLPATYTDFFLYLFGGFGIFVLSGGILAYVFNVEEITFPLVIGSILLNVLILGGCTYFLGIKRNKISWSSLGIFPSKWQPRYFMVAIGLAVGLMPLRGIVAFLVQLAVEGGFDSLNARADLFMVGGLTWSGFLINLVGIGVMAPVAEELYFRGLLHTWFRQKWGLKLGVAASSLVFGLAHFDSIGVAVSAWIMGIVIALAYERTKTLWLPIAIHIATNSVAVVFLYISMLLQNVIDLPVGF